MSLKQILLTALLTLAAITANGQDDPPLGVQLSLGEGKTSYRAGETITLVMTYKAYVPGYSVRVGQEVIDTILDEVQVSPAAGVFEWKKQYMRGAKYTSDAINMKSLNDGPVRDKFPLNHFVRFEAPGRYTVRVKSNRVGLGYSDPTVQLVSNEVSFNITMMTEAEEATEVARLSTALDKANGWQEQTRLMTQLSYLTGPAAIPEKIKRFLAPVESGNYHAAASYGLYMSKDRPTVIKMLEEVFRDINRPASYRLLRALISLRHMQEVPVPAKPNTRTPFFMQEEEPEELRIRNGYLKELVDTLPKRQGKNLNETAYLILQNLPRENPPTDVLAKVRGILIKHFDELTFHGQEMLLGEAYWKTVRDPLLIPSLEKMLTAGNYPSNARGILRSHALRRLSELDPGRARPFLIAEIRDAESMMGNDTIDSLENKLLPEVDEALVQQIRRFGANERGTGHRLSLRCMFAARFATNAVFDQLLDIYKTDGSKWETDSRAFLLSYFTRHRPKEALELIEAEVAKLGKGYLCGFLHALTRLYYAPELTSFIEKLLASDDPNVATCGAYILQMHGPATSRPKVEARLERWLARWRNREFELEGPQMKPENEGEAMLQIQLILTLRDGKNWKLNDSELRELAAECKTSGCDRFRMVKSSPVQ